VLDGRRAGTWAAACGGGALISALFLEWYDLGGFSTGWTYYGPPIGGTAWEAFALLDVVLALLALVPVARLLLPTIRPALALVAGLFASVLIGYRIAFLPDPDDQLVVETPAWLAPPRPC
jgi:hypothetical protein